MKLSHYVFIFFIVFVPMAILLDVQVERYSRSTLERVKLDDNIDQAVDAAMQDLIDLDDSDATTIDKDAAIESLWNSLYASFGILSNSVAKEEIKVYVPVVLLTTNDGFYVNYSKVVDGKVKRVWSAKYPYSFSSKVVYKSKEYKYNVTFTLDDYMYVSVDTLPGVYYGKRSDLIERYPALQYPLLYRVWRNTFMYNPAEFNAVKQEVIADSITSVMEDYLNQHNAIAAAYGISYNFRLTSAIKDSMQRAISDTSLLMVWQGYPVGIGTDDVYNKVSVAGTRTYKSMKYSLGSINGVNYYHKSSCKHGNTSRNFTSKVSAASTGALPCPYCNP